MTKHVFSGAKRNLKLPYAITGFIVLSALALVVTACTSQAQAKIMPTWITPQVSGKAVSILVSDVQKDTIVHFKVPDASGKTTTFMAYNLNGQTYARADICPPCGSTSFSLVGNTLVCNTCGTVFNAKTGDGISGACVNYPKAAVAFQADNTSMVMNIDDLNQAFQYTLAWGPP